MKHIIALALVFMMVTLTGCELVGDIFSAGFYTALFVVFLVVAIIIFYRDENAKTSLKTTVV